MRPLVHSRRAEVRARPETSGFSFRHELPNGTLDNTIKAALGGVALIDYDDDGKIDVFCANGGWNDALAGANAVKPEKVATCRLYRNLGGLKFEDVTEKAGVGFAGFAVGACVGDFDGDGLPDLFVSAYGMPALYRNRGDGTFEDVAAKVGIRPGFYAGATFLDYDPRRRRRPLRVAVRRSVRDPREKKTAPAISLRRRRTRRSPRVSTAAAATARSEDVTGARTSPPPGKGMGVLATDVDGDGWIDGVRRERRHGELRLAQSGRRHVRRRGESRFSLAFGSDGDMRRRWGVTAADLDGDGRLDYLVPDTQGGSVYVASGVAEDVLPRPRDRLGVQSTHEQVGWADVAFDADCDRRLDVWRRTAR